MQFYIVVKGYGLEELAGQRNSEFMNRYIEIKSGQVSNDEAKAYPEIKYKDMVECRVVNKSTSFGLQNYNDGWFEFLKEN